MSVAKRLTEWAWIDDRQRLCFDIPSLLLTLNVKDTPENRDAATEAAAAALRDVFPNLPQDVNTMEYGTKRIYHGRI